MQYLLSAGLQVLLMDLRVPRRMAPEIRRAAAARERLQLRFEAVQARQREPHFPIGSDLHGVPHVFPRQVHLHPRDDPGAVAVERTRPIPPRGLQQRLATFRI